MGLYVFLTLLGLILLGGLWVGWGWQRTRSMASIVYKVRLEEGEISKSVKAEDFEDAYIRSEGPRFSTYLLVTALFAVLAFPIIVYVFAQLWMEIWFLLRLPDWAERGSDVYLAGLVFLYMGFFFGIAWIAMQRFHVFAPPSLRAEIRRLNGATQ